MIVLIFVQQSFSDDVDIGQDSQSQYKNSDIPTQQLVTQEVLRIGLSRRF